MTTIRSALIMALAATLAACGGSSSGGPPSEIGIWEGTYVAGAGPTGGNLQLALLDDGTLRMRVDSGGGWKPATGTYSVTGADVTGSFTPDSGPAIDYLFAFTLSSGEAGGTLGTSPSSTDVGTFTVTKAAGGALGIWKGAYGVDSSPPSLDYLIIDFPGGDVEVYDGATLAAGRAAGTWSLSGTDYTADFTYDDGGASYTIIATLSGGTLAGTWGDPGDGTNGGTLSVTREK
jgi:hypothetical protein